MLKLVIFDLDGTLLDTSEGVFRSVRYVTEKLGLPALTDRQMRTVIGPPMNKSMERLYGMSQKEAFHAMELFRQRYQAGDIYLSRPYPGISDAIQRLRKMGLKTGVATYKEEEMSKKLLERTGIAQYMDVIHGANREGSRTKTDVIRLVMADLAASSSESLMIGDSDNDARGAGEAGAAFLGVTWGFGFKSPEDVDAFPNVGWAAAPEELPEKIGSILNS